MRSRWGYFGGTIILVGILSLAALAVAGPVLHEQFAADPIEDLRFGATTQRGSMPAAIETKSGVVGLPETASDQTRGTTYGGGKTADSADAAFRLDSVTSRPLQVDYDEPFRPSILPYKRMYAFDSLGPDQSFTVADTSLREMPIGGAALASEDVFFADFDVELVKNVPVRIPTVGPGAQVRALEIDPPSSVMLVHDGADNWFAQGQTTGKVRFLMQISIERQSFGSHFLPVGWAALAPYVHELPQDAARAAARVLAHIGVSRSQSPAGALRDLVSYFRKFEESADSPSATDPLELYVELSLALKGVCRHRAYAFAVTALALGLPTRTINNEAHAWVEVFDSELWHRIDLGGAPADLRQTRNDPTLVQHRPPPDPFSWPGNSAPAAAQFAQRLEPTEPKDASSSSSPTSGADGQTQAPEKDGNLPPGSGTWTEFDFENSGSEEGIEIELTLKNTTHLRGTPLFVAGSVQRAGRPCPLSRVDIYVQSGRGALNIGSVATSDQGRFNGQVTLPSNTPVGPLQLAARLAAGCN